MRVRCDGCGEIQFDGPVTMMVNGEAIEQPDETLHLHTYHKAGYFIWELRASNGTLLEGRDGVPDVGHLCPELIP